MSERGDINSRKPVFGGALATHECELGVVCHMYFLYRCDLHSYMKTITSTWLALSCGSRAAPTTGSRWLGVDQTDDFLESDTALCLSIVTVS